ncbi:hypothetical protein PCANC_26795 [Puccinia coronata f. sp. avenae]|uniref:Uncharacterized protein n=1 Tax=Puccinia coronata f. sp. avenae TaxID=200324 RepID=A0A2N5S2H6_9BASI|nr:hypothetical protein PCANC_26795 [Puccinia coronata f. sp. avenae]
MNSFQQEPHQHHLNTSYNPQHPAKIYPTEPETDQQPTHKYGTSNNDCKLGNVLHPSSWIQHPLARHRHHHSLDSSYQLANHFVNHRIHSAQFQSPTTPTDTSSAEQATKRSLSLSSQSTNKLTHPSPPSPAVSYTHPSQSLINNHPPIDTTVYPQQAHSTQKKSLPTPKTKSKLSLVAAVPASILKKEKPGLLSQEQKRANHIASEQKRRAAIRQGYSRLCLLVPALRAPIGGPRGVVRRTPFLENGDAGHEPSGVSRRSEEDSPLEEELSLDQPASQNHLHTDESANSAAFKRKRNKLPTEAHRAGTRSEAVVLAKTVEYLRELEAERKVFLEKLTRLKGAARAKGIPIYTPQQSTPQLDFQTDTTEDGYQRVNEKGDEEEEQGEPPVWECKWTGNIHQIDRQFNPELSSAASDHSQLTFNALIGPDLTTPPIPFDLASFPQDQQHAHLFHSHSHQNLNLNTNPQHEIIDP